MPLTYDTLNKSLKPKPNPQIANTTPMKNKGRRKNFSITYLGTQEKPSFNHKPSGKQRATYCSMFICPETKPPNKTGDPFAPKSSEPNNPPSAAQRGKDTPNQSIHPATAWRGIPMANTKQQVIDDPESLVVDKVLEKRLAELIGTTPKALEHKRLSGIIPQGVWLKEGGRIMYSLERYNTWAENQWASRLASKSEATRFGSALLGTVSVEVNRLPISRPRKGLQRPVVSVLV